MKSEQPPVKLILESALLAAGKPLSLEQLAQLFDEYDRPDKPTLISALEAISADCEGRGFELKQVASGWRFQIRQALSPWVGKLWDEKPARYTRALLETLALVAYRQPITRGEIEDIRGVSVSSTIMRTLQDREWVRIVGHRDVPGRPAMYATTRQFLDYFNLKNLNELPPLGEIRNLDDIAATLEGTVPEMQQASLEGMAENDHAVAQEPAEPLSMMESAQQLQEESEQDVARLFAELDEIENGLKTNFTDLESRVSTDADIQGETRNKEAVRVEITYDTCNTKGEGSSQEHSSECDRGRSGH